ncbi:hypothetical protein SynWH8101_1096 [Synechococcus sp. WH 8101]|nr:hypothetical protein SynWH8101_1096 [Synechococcus sp. WH 8101]QNI44904.1 hypothetical protein SynRCC2555_01118 [Synechococcus sp. WH 8101]
MNTLASKDADLLNLMLKGDPLMQRDERRAMRRVEHRPRTESQSM